MKDPLSEAKMLVKSSEWITNQMNEVSDYINSIDVDELSEEEVEEYLKLCNRLLQRSEWEEKQQEEFLKKLNKDDHDE